MYYLLLYDVVEDFINRRVPFRQEHINLAGEALRRGHLLMAGAFSEPADGAALLFRCDGSAVVRQFVEADPYVRERLVTRWRVRVWNVVVGADA